MCYGRHPRSPMRHRWPVLPIAVASLLALDPAAARADGFPKVLSIRERAETVNRITEARLERLLPRIMRETGIDMWIIATTEDNLDPVFRTMMKYETWAPIDQLLVLYDPGPGKPIERLNVARTNLKGLFQDAWDHQAWDKEKKESQFACLARIVRERDPKVIGINVGEVQWAAGGLTVSMKRRLDAALDPKYVARMRSAEPLATLWLETLLDQELVIYERATAVSHAIISEAMSSRVITPGVSRVEDIDYYYWQRAAELGLQMSFTPHCSIRGRAPDVVERYGEGDQTIRRGDLIHCDVGIVYLRYNTDHQEWAYVLQGGEDDVPAIFKEAMAETNKLQDIFVTSFAVGLTGDQILGSVLKKAREKGLRNPRVYSHSIGYYLHEPGPLVGLPWEQETNPGRGDVKVVDSSCFSAEMSTSIPLAEWGGKLLRISLEQNVAFAGGRMYFLDGRQTQFHLVR